MDRQQLLNDRSDSKARPMYHIEESRFRVKDMPARIRPREEMERLGVENVSDDVLLAIVLRTGIRGINVVDLARGLLRHFGSLTGLASASVDELRNVKGMGKVKAQTLMAALQIAKKLSEEERPEKYRIRTPIDAARLLRDRVRVLDTEVFWSMHLDARNYLKNVPVEVTRGLLDCSLVHPREVFRDAIRTATAAIVLAHNHPSGDTTPSAEDIRITRQLVEAGRIVDIKVLDHVILTKPTVGKAEFLSLRESGVVDF